MALQICRVEDINIEGIVTGCVVHFHWVRTVVVHSSGKITTSALGCTGGVGRRTVLKNGLAGGGGHGGKGGEAYYDGSFIEGGVSYGEADLPCELGSGSGNANLAGATAGGGIIVMGSLELSLSSLTVYGSLRADGESFGEVFRKRNRGSISNIGPGGGSGGGGGGWVHFHWSDIPTGDVYQPIASVRGSINTRHQGSSKLLTIKGPLSFYVVTKGPLPRGGFGRGQSHTGENGTITGKECPLGTFKNVSGSDRVLCHQSPANELPSLVILLALVLSIARMKYVGGDELPPLMPAQRGSQIDHSFPFLESLNEVLETNRTEESQSHVHRIYFMGPNTFTVLSSPGIVSRLIDPIFFSFRQWDASGSLIRSHEFTFDRSVYFLRTDYEPIPSLN
ncbi:hypothetical protein V6N11_049412 [Hibiscus sabdariffa]|uniref:DUF8003 domain-containing protein n=1 Tax=Hibiscus sabdariffa TaxID=183260 RepID=A0ABR2NA72_9ROSI